MKTTWLAALALSFSLATPALGETTLVFAYWGDPAELPPFEEIIAAYTEREPEVTIEVQHAPWSGYFTRLDAQLAAGAGPDVFFITNVPSYAARGALEPLDEYIEASGFPIDQYDAAGLKLHQLDGQLFSIARDSAPNALYYNKDAFDEAGIAYPDATWDWGKLREAALALTKRDGGRIARYGLVLESNDWPNFIYQNGGRIYDDPLKPTAFLMAEEPAAEAIQFIGDLINEDEVMPSFQEMAQIGGSTQLFASGQTAMVITNAARLPTFASAPFAWSVAPLPSGPSGIRSNLVGGAGFAINANSDNKDAAWDFLEFLAGAEGQIIFAKSGTAVPAMSGNAEVRAAFDVPHAGVFLAETEHGNVRPQFAKTVEINDLHIQPALDLVWNGESTAADALAAIEDSVNAALKAD